MKKYEFTDRDTFQLDQPDFINYLYFPLANKFGIMSSIAPDLSGDCKTGQNTFLLAPVSSEDLHNSKSSRNFWCKLNHSDIWSATGRSAGQQAAKFTGNDETSQLEAGFLWHRITRTSGQRNLKAVITSFVPTEDAAVELMKVDITNNGTKVITIEALAAIPLYCRSAENLRDHRHVTSLLQRIEVVKNGVIVNPTLTFDERGHKINRDMYGVFAGNGEVLPSKFYPTAEAFIGEGGSYENPRALQDSSMRSYQPGDQINGYEAFGGIGFEETVLQPGNTITYIVALTFGRTQQELMGYADKYLEKERFNQIFENTLADWNRKLNISFETGKESFNRWMRWVTIQPVLRRIFGCSFLPHHDYGKGGRGWRDLWQDCLALLMMEPEEVKGMLVDNFQGVRMDGTNATIIGKKQGEFIADRNNITRVWMDHGAWPFITTNLYIQQSGDTDILLEETVYFKDPQAVRGEEKDALWSEEQGNRLLTADNRLYTGTILEHLLIQHMTAFFDVGEHNHMKLRGGDWNDALDMAREKGESAAFTALYGSNFEQLANLTEVLLEKGTISIKLATELEVLLGKEDSYLDPRKKQDFLKEYCDRVKHRVSGEFITVPIAVLSKTLRTMGQFIKNHIQSTEWIGDGENHHWYNGYYDNTGYRVEGSHTLGARMMLTSQVFTIMSGIATAQQVKEITQAADQYLYSKENGGYRLNTDFKEIDLNLGRMFGFAYGQKENGAVFCHMAVMYANALYTRGFVKEGFKVIDSLYTHSIDFERSRIYPGIPEYFDGEGRGRYHYLTGAASWFLLTVLQQMFGIVGKLGDLCFEPKLLAEQFDEKGTAGIIFDFAGYHFHVVYINEHKLDYGFYRIVNAKGDTELTPAGDGFMLERRQIKGLDADKIYEIRLYLGE
jgi:cellobiose phosphorylase